MVHHLARLPVERQVGFVTQSPGVAVDEPELKPTRTGTGRRWILQRCRQLLATVFCVVLIAFAMVHLLPGNPAVTILGIYATPESLAALEHQLHLDRPLVSQLGYYLGDLVRGDLGISLVQGSKSVASLVLPALGITLWVVVSTVVVATLLAIPIGLAAGWSRRRGVDAVVRVGAMVLLAIPPFVVGLLLLLVVALKLNAAPAGGWAGNFLGDWAYLWLPVLALAAHLLPTLVMVIRQSVLETAGQHFVEAAISRGLSPRRVIVNHVLKNSLLPLITVMGLNIGGLIGGAVVIETVFTLPGIGQLLVNSVSVRDYPVVQAVVVLTALVTVLSNFVADILYRRVDPRTKSADR